MCEVLNEKTLDGTSKTSAWLMNSNFSDNCSDLNSTSSEEMSLKNSGVKARSDGGKIVKASGEISRHLHRKHSSSIKHHKSKKHEHTRTVDNIERFNNTAALLRRSGLLQITQGISQLVNDNKKLQTEIDKLEQETKNHSRQLQRQLQKKLETESESNGSCNPEGHKLLTRLSRSLLQWDWKNPWTQATM